MFFLQAAKPPVIVIFGQRKLLVPKMDMEQVVNWAAEIDAERTDEQTKGLNPAQRREFLTAYPPIPPDLSEMKRMCRTAPGIERIMRAQLQLAEVYDHKTNAVMPNLTPEDVEAIMQVNGIGRMSGIAWALADLNDTSLTNPNEDSGDDADDPSKGGGKPGLPVTSETGQMTSPSSKSPGSTGDASQSPPSKQE